MTKSHQCFGCETQIADEPGNYYCDPCIDKQTQAQDTERRAFVAFHKFADERLRLTQ